jgi:hypothetical protein
LDCQKLKSLMRSVLRPEAKLKAKLSPEKRSDVTQQLFESEGDHCEETAATVGSEQVSVFRTFRSWYLGRKIGTGTPQNNALNPIRSNSGLCMGTYRYLTIRYGSTDPQHQLSKPFRMHCITLPQSS